MEINVQATIGTCTEFMTNTQSEKREVSVVISPLKVLLNDGQNKLAILTGCNMWRSCFNAECWFSIKARTKVQEGK